MEKLQQLIERIEKVRDSISSEEATKTSLIMPFFQLLGYDVFNPLEFVPEYTADLGKKKKEKVDYAIMIDNKPLIFVECKACNEKLDKYSIQLERYFVSTIEAKFAILTNGIVYNFYTDLDNSNLMDKRPFLSIDLLNLRDRDIVELEKFKKEQIDVNNIINAAENLKYTGLIKDWLEREISEPSASLVKLVIGDIYKGIKNQKVIDTFTPIVKRAFGQYINDEFNSKLKEMLNKKSGNEEDVAVPEQSGKPDAKPEIITTIEELEAYGIIKAILRKTVDSSRIAYKDTASYFGVLLDNNTWKWICRVCLYRNKKFIIVSDENKNGIRYDIEKIDDIYKYSDEIIAACNKYL